tara:strand:- start:27 stop:692 length:666 start_codon:yes stop_codon:yes gene_type:complete
MLKTIIYILRLKKIPHLNWSSNQELNFKPKFITLFFLLFGLTLFGIGETLLVTANIGVSPWFVLHQGLSFITGYSIGVTTFIVSICVLFFWIPLSQKPGIGTIMNAIIISVVIDFSLPYLPNPSNIYFQIFQVIIGIFIIGIGSGFYLIANLGPGPRDGLMTGLQRKTNVSITLIRTFIELSAVVIGFYLGGILGFGTILYALGIGFSVSSGLYIVQKFFK